MAREKKQDKGGETFVVPNGNLKQSGDIERCIFTIRGVQVMLDKDLAVLYGTETKRLNEQVRRNADRFPEHFRFRLTNEEMAQLVANCDRLRNLKHSSSASYVFTEKDFGKKIFAFNRMEENPEKLLDRIK